MSTAAPPPAGTGHRHPADPIEGAHPASAGAGPSGWQRDDPACEEQPALARDTEAEVVVVGAGLAGLALAYHLARHLPPERILVLEAGRAGDGASGRSTGIAGPGVGGPVTGQVRKYGPDTARRMFDASLRGSALPATRRCGPALAARPVRLDAVGSVGRRTARGLSARPGGRRPRRAAPGPPRPRHPARLPRPGGPVMIDSVTTPSPADYRKVAGRFATGVTVLTVAGSAPHGCTASSFTSVSLEPLLVSVCLTVTSSLLRRLPEDRRFGITILAAHQRPLARHFANPHRPTGLSQFDGWPWRPGPYSEAPLLSDALGWLECRVARRIPAGDHVIVLAEVHTVRCGSGSPLLHFDGGFLTDEPEAHPCARLAGPP